LQRERGESTRKRPLPLAQRAEEKATMMMMMMIVFYRNDKNEKKI
jgi:hypothetical protein